MNLLDMAGIAIPIGFLDVGGSGHKDDSKHLPFGVTISGPAFSDRELLRLAESVGEVLAA